MAWYEEQQRTSYTGSYRGTAEAASDAARAAPYGWVPQTGGLAPAGPRRLTLTFVRAEQTVMER